MRRLSEQIQDIAAKLLADGIVDVVLGYAKGDQPFQSIPYAATTPVEAKNLLFDPFCDKALTKYLLDSAFQGKKVGLVLKGCDARALRLMIDESRVNRSHVYVIGVACPGLIRRDSLALESGQELHDLQIEFSKDYVTVLNPTEQRIPYEKVLSPFCLHCSHPTPPADLVDQLLESELTFSVREKGPMSHEASFAQISALEKMTREERHNFWARHLSRCKRCFSCRNVCPACTCRTCLFSRENPDYLDAAKDQIAQHQFYQIIRAFHLADRCVGCGECERACPEGVPLHLLNQKLVRELERHYGPYQAGVDSLPTPLSFAKADEPNLFGKGG